MNRACAVLLAAVLPFALLAGCSKSSDSSDIPEAASKIMSKPAYQGARWIYHVQDAKTGEVLLSNRADELVFTGSTAKLFTVGSVLDTLGADTKLKTPVYATSAPVDGTVNGDLVLVASGDLALGGRGAMQGRMDESFTDKTIDHVYGNIAPIASTTGGDPLAGLNYLAGQIAKKGVKTVQGDVVIDSRLWKTFQGQEGPVPPIFVNDNILDLNVTPAGVGESATVKASPETNLFTVVSEVKTAKSDTPAEPLGVSADPNDPHRLIVTGTIPAGKPQLTIYRVPNAADWARTLFIEALGRAGVSVTSPAIGTNNEANLSPKDVHYEPLAVLESPTLGEMGKMINLTSYNTGANAFLCLLAVKDGSTDCDDGLKVIRKVIEKAHLDSDEVVLVDGQGADPASTTPRQMAKWLTWTDTQPWGKDLDAGLPRLGETGTLASVAADPAAKGKVMAKTGTSAALDPATMRALFNVQSLAGFMVTKDGRRLVFDLSMSGGTYPSVGVGLTQSNDDVGGVAAAFQQALSK
ncbi:D-alanyl-D-alanine carboxypeptidase/D-alanyl-D-alanine-endopeptidase [Smaragdicoccus niigatensis]|uniref:D-alanyl-D-alanine carboxypeptidase/D-alanyl-D-alanine endopeptidase n=2 Tax=Smaragdicoccus niigatensis TaxID=359359 RepID=UPI00037706D5|nr:D-alanyl-D-alanine carboxypeptidase/D-alanyl-D-alanine-endopeptidase [Smaragdicoccus niigatensis]